MALIRFASDLHNEKIVGLLKRPTAEQIAKMLEFPVPMAEDKDTIMVLPGDLWEGLRSLKFGPGAYNWLKQMSDRFKAVILVLGNHDLWGETLPGFYTKYRDALVDMPNVHLLESWVKFPSVVIDGIRFAGGTLWTDMGKGNPQATWEFDYLPGMDGRPMWNDRNYIRVGHSHKKFSAMDAMSIHRQTLKNLATEIDQSAEPVCLVFHHAPSTQSCADRIQRGKAGDVSHYFYASDLSNFILDRPQIKMIVHGHTHDRSDYLIGDFARNVCNPRGYVGDPVKAFKEDWRIELPADINFRWTESSPSFGM